MDSHSQVGEGAIWDERAGVLWWLDIPAGLLHRFDPASGENTSQEFGEPVGCLALRETGGMVLACKSGFWLYDWDSGRREPLSDPEAHLPENRFNDGTTDARGRFWAGTMKDGGEPEPMGRFYRLDTDFNVTPWKDGIYTTNGQAFSPDGTIMYYSDSNAAVRTVWAADYDLDTGTPHGERVFFDTRSVKGRPDGGTVDADGCYWMAGVSGGQVYRITPDGKLDMTIDVPVERPSKPMFGGPDLKTLYLTSIGAGADLAAQPQAGGLFAITGTGAQGVPQWRFGG
ncbi:hypothetical protein AVJ23_07205 [Pseudoponticoccus marisrubri]|uniref:SMP-30/Gluconolactonase/LRE-like region domain-containing protein n=1 Tax=Pseudoponticoccus marisrubri TaxID=1685382 RepID=A0A0W7WM23_9RHOB|nr:hypothetical protein AVJ23_07205 [Pseudoponticoccus marisrubri]